MQDRAQAFMKDQIMPGTKLLFDGSSFFARMGDSLAVKGYNPDHSLDPQVRMGYFSFCSNIDAEAKVIYLDYQERWNIEECFDYLKNPVSPGASYAHNDNYFRGWAFLNHVSLLYFYGLINALRSSNLDGKYTPEDVLKLTKNIYKVDCGNGQGYKVSAIQKKTSELLNKLGVDLLRKN